MNTTAETGPRTCSLAALQFYQLAIPPPAPPDGSFDRADGFKKLSLTDQEKSDLVEYLKSL